LGVCQSITQWEKALLGNRSSPQVHSPVAEKLGSLGVEFKVMQELMRHSSLRSTLDVYTQAVGPAKRAAQAAVLSLFFPSMDSEDDCVIIGTA